MLPYLRPDGKSQVTVEYGADHKPRRVDAVVISTQHADSIDNETLRADIMKHVDPGCGSRETCWMPTRSNHINPTGTFCDWPVPWAIPA